MTTTLVADEGIFIPRELLPVGGEWIMTIIGREIVLRPKISPAEARQRMREISDELLAKYGEFPDSTPLIREDRDER